ncbi:MAG: hypothetical protein WDO17_18190 [Alphaproteobacteria bacterium]
MAFEPIKLVESLTKGVIEALYDLARLAAAGLAVPFVYRNSRFWLWLISINNRISSLTYLFIGVLICVTVLSEASGRKFVAGAVGLEKSADTTALTIVLITLATTVLIDLPLRVAFSAYANEERRKLYVAFGHLAFGFLFLGAVLILLLTPNYKGLIEIVQPMSFWIDKPLRIVLVPMPLIFLFSAPLVVLLAKSIRISRWWLVRLAIGLVLTPMIVMVLANAMLYLTFLSFQVTSWVSPNVLELRQTRTLCDFSQERARISGFLTIKGPASYPLEPDALGISYARSGQEFVGKVRAGQPGIALSSSSYTWIDLVAERDPKDRDSSTEPPQSCWFILLKDLFVGDGRVSQPKDRTEVTR